MVPALLRRSLRLRLIAACMVVEALMLTLIVGNSVRLVERHLVRLAESRVQQMEETFGASLAAPLAARDHAVLRSQVKQLAGLEGVAYVALFDNSGTAVAAAGPVPQPIPAPDSVFSDATPIHAARSEITLYGQPLGHLRYGLSTDFLRVAKGELLTQGLAIALLEVVLTSVALIAVGVLLTARLEALTKASLRMAEGDYRTLVEVKGEDEVAKLAHAFNIMAGAVSDKVDELEAGGRVLRASNAELRRLAEVTAHHLQEPVRSVANFAQLLESRHSKDLDGEATDYLHYIVAGAKRSRRLLSDLQSYVSIDMTPLAPSARADLAVCAQRVHRVLAARIAERRATVEIGPLPLVLGDPAQLETVLRLLLENSLDHSDKPAPRIGIEAVSADDQVLVRVVDNGPGIPEEYRERVFELFEILDRSSHGTGIGLAAVRKMIRRHGGEVWLSSPADGGLVVNLTLTRAG